MKKVIRLNEKDVENLVKKIISEENKSINEGPLDWVRKKRFSDEEVALAILKGVELGEAFGLNRNNVDWRNDIYTFQLGGHDVEVKIYSGVNRDSYYLKVDDEMMDTSDSVIKKIIRITSKITDQPRRKKVEDIKTSMNRYNLPDEERKKLEDTDKYFE